MTNSGLCDCKVPFMTRQRANCTLLSFWNTGVVIRALASKSPWIEIFQPNLILVPVLYSIYFCGFSFTPLAFHTVKVPPDGV